MIPVSESQYAVKKSSNESPLWKENRAPLGRIDMELTERCNNNCIHCCISLPADDKEAQSKELTTAEWKSLLKQVRCPLAGLSVRFTGGEPLLREDFEELYLTARRLGLKVMLFTNATLITPRLASLFARIPPLEKIEISVYGMHRNPTRRLAEPRVRSRTPGLA